MPKLECGTYQKLANLEVAPDTKLVIRIHLPNGHPLVVCANGSEFPVREARARRGEATPKGRIVAIGSAGLPSLVRDLVIVLESLD